MLIRRNINYFFVLFILVFPFLPAEGSFFTTFFDVGQGNCTLIDYRNDHDPRDLILVDGGSSSYQGKDKKDDNYKEKMIKQIAATICQALVNEDKVRIRGLKIIISHADSDHLNWITLIIDECARLLRSDEDESSPADYSFVIKLFLGSEDEYMRQAEEKEQTGHHKKSDATPAKSKRRLKKKVDTPEDGTPYVPKGGKKKLLRKKKKGSNQKQFLDYFYEKKIPVTWVTSKGSTLKATPVDVSEDEKYTCSILPALQYTSPQKANDPCLVVRVRYDKKVIMLSGDATGATVAHIIKCCDSDYLKTTVLQASHHGAERDDCNSEEWIKATSPTYVVFSAGIHLNFMHPVSAILRRYFEHLPTPDAECFEYRPFYSGLEKEIGSSNLSMIPFERARFQEGYGLGVCSKGLYSTLNQGTIYFSLRDGRSNIACANRTAAPSGAESLIQAINNNPYEGFFQLATLTLLNLGSFGLDDTMPPIKGILETLLESLTARATGLEKFYINNNSLCEKVTLTKLLGLYRMMLNKFLSHQEEELSKETGAIIRPFEFDIRENHFPQALLQTFPGISVRK